MNKETLLEHIKTVIEKTLEEYFEYVKEGYAEDAIESIRHKLIASLNYYEAMYEE